MDEEGEHHVDDGEKRGSIVEVQEKTSVDSKV